MIIKITGLILSGLMALTQAQQSPQFTYPRDTTYTLKIAYSKYKEYHPFIKAVEYDPENGTLQKSIAFDAPAGRPLMLDLFFDVMQPAKQKATVMLVHGGGWSSGDRSLMYPLADYLAKKGFIAVAIEYRLSPEARYPAAVNDISTAVSWVLNNSSDYHIDTQKTAILGCSAGAQLAALVGLTFSSDSKKDNSQKVIHAIINIDGIMDFTAEEARKYEDDPDRESTPAGRWFGGRYAEKPVLWKEASPVYYVNKNAPPMLFLNSSHARFHVGRDETIRVLDSNSIYSEVHTFEDAPHSFWLFDPWFDPTAAYITAFLKKVFEME